MYGDCGVLVYFRTVFKAYLTQATGRKKTASRLLQKGVLKVRSWGLLGSYGVDRECWNIESAPP